MKRKFGLIGYPLGHSFSKGYFNEKFRKEQIRECEYNNYPIEKIDAILTVIEENPGLIGLNVTIPFKESVLQYMDTLDDIAKGVGAVNTIKIERNDSRVLLHGYNTDAYGFYHSIKPHLKQYHKSALILGTGGASKAVSYAFDQLNIDHCFVSRTPKKSSHLSYIDLCEKVISNFSIIVNASPLGMYPYKEKKPDIPYEHITSKHVLYDLIYNPEKTSFLREGEKGGAVIINGLEMLHLQAERSWQIWNNEIV